MSKLLTAVAIGFALLVATPAAPAQEAPPHLITVNKAKFRLTLYHRDPLKFAHYKVERRWKVAVGAVGHRTPSGAYAVGTKVLNPGWTAPDSSWVPTNQRGKFFQGGDPRNPIAAAWMGIDDRRGLGIHGTTNTASLGTRASHGCIRMSVPAVKSLYRRIALGTPVVIY